jgi:CheY-like chemotaxis protein
MIVTVRYYTAAVTGMGTLSGRRILVVEDEALIALDLQGMLDQRGATVVGPAATVSEALKTITENQIDCALLDLKLGDETADPVAAALKQRAIPTVFVTAYGDGHLPPRGVPDNRKALQRGSAA